MNVKKILPTIIALAVGVNATKQANESVHVSPGGGFSPIRTLHDLFAIPFPPSYFETLNTIQQAIRISSPKYEITQDAKKYQVTVDVPGIKASDLKVELLHDGRVLKLSGERKEISEQMTGGRSERRTFSSKFEELFTLDDDIVKDKISAYVNNGVLYVVAPKEELKTEKQLKSIKVEEISDKQMEKLEKEHLVETITE
mmetsp:Transcript_21790/g.32586  ORF Transcript_21790/g.32586 Transcript_21790/m.32586 type:complete len:199 (-) Transcript_21790:194-790(-)|eukprot:CAMPEP_0116034666 /NCGR_PEP_ID=MMETSP0321-20121206/19767_1 /TAXON_ID=163516 /ORGANISM="Leptocylindrus danicus var. danicus, Strain B650" /LENGTH=198 /DNA_ID=CAMNT_0003511069 /DNA_START=50 /DNA_END=646 /DNA_ORIENTATION=-